MSRPYPFLSACLLALMLPLPAAASESHVHEEQEEHHLSEIPGLKALHAWTPATSGRSALVYVELENTGDAPVALEGAEAEIAGDATLVGFALENGEPAYVPLPSMPIQPGRELVLAPDGLAIRLDGLSEHLDEGGEFEMHLLTSLGELEIHVAIEPAGATQHSHAGHQH